MSSKTITANLKISNYGNRVLGIVKEKYNLKDKSQALNKMLELYGSDFLDREVKDEVIRDMIKEVENVNKKRTYHSSFDELDKLCGLK